MVRDDMKDNAVVIKLPPPPPDLIYIAELSKFQALLEANHEETRIDTKPEDDAPESGRPTLPYIKKD